MESIVSTGVKHEGVLQKDAEKHAKFAKKANELAKKVMKTLTTTWRILGVSKRLQTEENSMAKSMAMDVEARHNK